MFRLKPPLIAALLIVALGAIGACKYTGGDSEGSEREAEAPGAEQRRQPAEEPAEEPELEDQEEGGDDLGLGEGTDEQRRLIAQAKQAFLTNQIDKAEQIFEELAQTDPVSGPQVSATIALAQIYRETDRSKEAVELLEGLAERVGEVPEVHLVIARALAEQGESTRAIAAYERVLELQPDFVFALLELSELFAQAGREEEATKTVYAYEKKVYSLAKELEDAETPVGERLRVLDVFALLSDDRATEAAVKVIADSDPRIRRRAAIALGEMRAAEAREVLEEASVSDPDMGARMAAKDALERIDKGGAPDSPGIGPTFVGDRDELPDQ
jgi:tetratricopeptide (TPR) repeat protein